MLLTLLKKWDPTNQTLLFIGDLADRGPESRACINLVRRLVKEEAAICLRGNHEQLLLDFLRKPDDYFGNYLTNGGTSTISSLFPELNQNQTSPHEIAKLIKENYPEMIEFIQNLPLYFEWGNFIFVHAGVQLAMDDWKKTETKEFYWIREPFHQAKNRTGKTIVFGHTPTPYLHAENNNFNIWISDNKIGIDGGAVYGGILHGLVLDKDGIIEHYGVKKQEKNLKLINFKRKEFYLK